MGIGDETIIRRESERRKQKSGCLPGRVKGVPIVSDLQQEGWNIAGQYHLTREVSNISTSPKC